MKNAESNADAKNIDVEDLTIKSIVVQQAPVRSEHSYTTFPNLSQCYRKPAAGHTVRTVESTPTKATLATLRSSSLLPTPRLSAPRTRMLSHLRRSLVSTGGKLPADALKRLGQHEHRNIMLRSCTRWCVMPCGSFLVVIHVYMQLLLCHASAETWSATLERQAVYLLVPFPIPEHPECFSRGLHFPVRMCLHQTIEHAVFTQPRWISSVISKVMITDLTNSMLTVQEIRDVEKTTALFIAS